YQKDTTQNKIRPITNENGFQYADFSVDAVHKYLYCLRLKSTETQIIRIEIQTGRQEVLFQGADFYSNVRVSLDGTKILFLQWNYHNMPWDENELWSAEIDIHYEIKKLKKVYHQQKTSIYQPAWYNNTIYAAVDTNNFSQICKIEDNKLTPTFTF